MKKITICFIVCLSLSIIACGRNQNAGAGNGTVEVYHNVVLNIKQHYDGITFYSRKMIIPALCPVFSFLI